MVVSWGVNACYASAGLGLSTLVFAILFAIEKHDRGSWPTWASFQQARPASDLADISFSPEGGCHSQVEHARQCICLRGTYELAPAFSLHAAHHVLWAEHLTLLLLLLPRRCSEEQHRNQKGLYRQAEGALVPAWHGSRRPWALLSNRYTSAPPLLFAYLSFFNTGL